MKLSRGSDVQREAVLAVPARMTTAGAELRRSSAKSPTRIRVGAARVGVRLSPTIPHTGQVPSNNTAIKHRAARVPSARAPRDKGKPREIITAASAPGKKRATRKRSLTDPGPLADRDYPPRPGKGPRTEALLAATPRRRQTFARNATEGLRQTFRLRSNARLRNARPAAARRTAAGADRRHGSPARAPGRPRARRSQASAGPAPPLGAPRSRPAPPAPPPPSPRGLTCAIAGGEARRVELGSLGVGRPVQ